MYRNPDSVGNAIPALETPDLRFQPFEAKVRIREKFNHYCLKTVETPEELHAVLRLRHDVFCAEYGRDPSPDLLDFDAYDLICDHIVITDERNGRIIGTYRMISSHFSEKFYSQEEFGIDDFLVGPGVKLELGRACVHPDYRKGAVIHLLWRGISAYATAIGARYLFGCSSIQKTDLLEVALCQRYFSEQRYFSKDYAVTVNEKYRIPHLSLAIAQLGEDSSGEELEEKIVQSWIPPLLRSYLKAGAKIFGEPALDMDFRCFDCFTVLETEGLAKSYEKKYFK